MKALALSLERAEIALQVDDPVVVSELEAYEGERNPRTGRMIYGAPEGHDSHDDCVISLALADYARLHLMELLALLGEDGDGEETERVKIRAS